MKSLCNLLLLSALYTLTVWTAGAIQTPSTIAFVGDIMMGTTYPSVQLPPNDGRQLFVDAQAYLQSADVSIGNLEGTLCDGGQTRKQLTHSSYAFRTPTLFAPRLKEAGFDYLSLANNHIYDFGEEGVHSTCKSLASQGMAFSGLASLPPVVRLVRNGVRFGICTFGYNHYTLRHQNFHQARIIITKLVNTCDVVIVTFHGGAEGSAYSRLPYGKETFCGEDRGSLREFAHFCIDAGADVVVGHGPHVPRAMELYKNHLVAYSLGNFCTPYAISITGVSGYAPLLTLSVDQYGRMRQARILSFLQHKGRGPVLDTNHHAAQEISRLCVLDFPKGKLRITKDGHIYKVS